MSAENEQPPARLRRRVHHFRKFKEEKRRIVFITAHDFASGLAADKADVDAVLVGDSLGMVALGFDSTLPVTMEMMLHHTAAVRRAVKYAFLIADMPFLSYQISAEDAVRNAGRFVQEAGAEAVKLEGCCEVLPAIERIIAAGIPVLGHIGLLPQAIHRTGGYKVRGRTEQDAEELIREAKLLEEAGAFAIVLEGILPGVAERITQEVKIPTIGIGAGGGCDGQILVFSDVVGLTASRTPKFAKRYATALDDMTRAVSTYAEEVRAGTFPGREHEY
ncbi:MAG: 3-methyl-2-oxobutanoate hydroxymethyltransferase [Candidatus Sumerlaeaceae bacterium]|nr:3-methyl-2-oxobutanoate hydroxymethyltransferase [Candidatus Sumerlaeaceae bacterium]